MPIRDRLALAGAVLILLWVLWPFVRRFFCNHVWRTRATVAGFGVPILDQVCQRCKAPRAVHGANPPGEAHR